MQSPFEFFKHHLGQTSPFPLGIEVSYANGPYIFDNKGNGYLDLISGIAVSNLGHGHPKIIEAIKTQAEKFTHVMVYGEMVQPVQNKFAENLLHFLPESLNCVYPVNSGTEANEAALKLAKRVTNRTKIVSTKGAYHGSTHGSLSISSNELKKAAFRPLLPEVYFIELNNKESLEIIDEQTACVIIEPVQGDAGVRVASNEFLNALRNKCNQTGTLLIFDEIQCGMGRTGKMFAFEHSGVIPDILTSGKALGGGLPVGALISSEENLQQFQTDPMLGHITTFGGNPVIMAAAAAALEIYKNELDFDEVESKGKFIEATLQHPEIKEIRRKGMMFAIEFDHADKVEKIVKGCLAEKVITYWFLSCPESFRIAPPLTITQKELEKGINTINQVMYEML